MLNKEFNTILKEDDEILSNSFYIEKERIIQDLKEKHIQHRKFMREQEERKLMDDETQKKLFAEQEKLQALKSESTSNAYVDRRFRAMSAKAKSQNERMKNLLNKVDNYMKRIEKIDEIQTLKIKAEKEFIQEEKNKKVDSTELGNIVGRLTKLSKQGLVERENNIKKMKDREKSKNKIIKNSKTMGKGLLTNLLPSIIRPSTGTAINPNTTKNKMNNLFNLEEDLVGTNALPEKGESQNYSIIQSEKNSEKNIQKNLLSSKNKSNLNSNPNNINDKQEADIELRKILKNGATAESLMKFKNKYKWFDISPYLHKVQMEMVKKRTKNKNIINEYTRSKIISEKMLKFTNFSNDKKPSENEKNQENNELNESQQQFKDTSFPSACLSNNSSLIQSKLLACKDDAEVFNLVNEKDEFNRKGIIYLILHGNFPMIKLCIMSGLILSDTRDKFDRNFLHYIALSKSSKMIEVFLKCFLYEYKEDYEGMMKYMGKIYLKDSVDEQMELTEEEISEFFKFIENSFENFDQKICENTNNEENEEKKPEEDEYKLNVISSNQSQNENLKFTNSMTVTNQINLYFEELKKNKISLSSLINQLDSDQRTPLHLACKYNNIEVIKTLLFHNVNVDLKDNLKNRAIDYCSHENETVIQYIISHSKNIKSKLKMEKSSFMGKILGLDDSNKNKLSLNEDSHSMLDISNLKFIPDSKLNSFTNGIENNSYLILSVIEDKFDTFKYLLTRGINFCYVNSNGWNVLHFIINLKRYKYLYYIFNLEKGEKEEISKNIKISEIHGTLKTTEYSSSNIFDSSGNLTILGQAFLSLDIMTNNQMNILFMSIDSKVENCYLFKILLNLLIKREMLIKSGIVLRDKFHLQIQQNSISPLEIILNRKYDKSLSTLLIKIVTKKNFDLLIYLIQNLFEEYISYMNFNSFSLSDLSYDENTLINIYETDKSKQNVLHVIVKNKLDEKFLKFFIKLDADKNLLKSMKDSNEKFPQDYDTSKQYAFSNCFIHIWEAARSNDHILLEKIIQAQGDIYSINEQTILYGNTPLHMAAISGSDKTALYLVNNTCDINIKNKKNLTPLDCALSNKNLSKNFIRKLKAIINKEITDYEGLESYGKLSANNTMMNNSNLSFMNNSSLGTNSAIGKKVINIINKIKTEVTKRKLNFKKIFNAIDENKNGKLEGHEFESLFTVIDIEGVSRDDVLLLMSFLDRNKNGIIEYEEFMKILE